VKGLDYYSRAIFGQVWPRSPIYSVLKEEMPQKQELSVHFDATASKEIATEE
jgi:hypothetical protein